MTCILFRGRPAREDNHNDNDNDNNTCWDKVLVLLVVVQGWRRRHSLCLWGCHWRRRWGGLVVLVVKPKCEIMRLVCETILAFLSAAGGGAGAGSASSWETMHLSQKCPPFKPLSQATLTPCHHDIVINCSWAALGSCWRRPRSGCISSLSDTTCRQWIACSSESNGGSRRRS